MKKTILIFMVIMCVCLVGCIGIKQPNYITKYIANCETTEFRNKPSNDATIINMLKEGEAVSYECDADNGYSKVIYQGNAGYVLSVNLEYVKPVQNNPVVPPQTPQPVQNNNYSISQYEKILSNASSGDIENYITNYVRPYYNKVNGNIGNYTEKNDGTKKMWYSGSQIVKMELNKGANGYNYSRQYYFDDTTGNLIFAFVFDGTTEYRLYFDVNRIMRFIDNKGNVFDNPQMIDALEMAEFVLDEAYVQ